MAPFTHLLASWLVASAVTPDRSDVRRISLAGVLPDLDGLGLVLDWIHAAHGRQSFYYAAQHHYWLHGWAGGLLLAGILAAFARRKRTVFLASLAVFHLHLLCDLVGSRGPEKHDLWAVYYSGPFHHDWAWLWRGQWRLDGWENTTITFALFTAAIGQSLRKGHSFVGVVSDRLDVVFVGLINRWRSRMRPWFSRSSPSVS